jgi:hypothetical protein
MSPLFYMPQKAALGDVIPFCGGNSRSSTNLGRSLEFWRLADWYLLGTQDFVHYKDYAHLASREDRNHSQSRRCLPCVLMHFHG